MEKNCLVKELLANVQDTNPRYFDKVILHVKEDTTHASSFPNINQLTFRGTDVVKLKVIGSTGYFSESSALSTQLTEKTYDFRGHEDVLITIYVPNLTFDIEMSGVYCVNYIGLNGGGVDAIKSVISFNANEFGYNDMERVLLTCSDCNFDIKNVERMPNLAYLTGKNSPNVVGNLEALKNRTFTYLQLSGTKVSGTLAQLLAIPAYQNKSAIDVSVLTEVGGDISALADETQLVTFNAVNNRQIFGSIESLVKLTNLTTLSLAGAYANAFTGSIENFVAGQIANGRSQVTISNKIFCPWILTYATFGGNYYTTMGGHWLTWDSASKITIYYSTTSAFDNYSHVYAKGATAEEITAWENAGKIVHIIS